MTENLKDISREEFIERSVKFWRAVPNPQWPTRKAVEVYLEYCEEHFGLRAPAGGPTPEVGRTTDG